MKNKYFIYAIVVGHIGLMISAFQKLNGNELYHYGMSASLIIIFLSILFLIKNNWKKIKNFVSSD